MFYIVGKLFSSERKPWKGICSLPFSYLVQGCSSFFLQFWNACFLCLQREKKTLDNLAHGQSAHIMLWASMNSGAHPKKLAFKIYGTNQVAGLKGASEFLPQQQDA